jgi:hypothetical protein
MGSEAGKRIAPLWIKKTPRCTLKRVGGLGDNVRKKHRGTFASDEPEKVLPFDEGLLKGRRFSFRLLIFNFLGWWWGKLKNLPLGN